MTVEEILAYEKEAGVYDDDLVLVDSAKVAELTLVVYEARRPERPPTKVVRRYAIFRDGYDFPIVSSTLEIRPEESPE